MSVSSSDDQIPITSRHRKKHAQIVDESSSDSGNDIQTLLQSARKLSIYRYHEQSHERIPPQTEAKFPGNHSSVNNLPYQNESTSEESASPIILSFRARHKTQTKLTHFFAPFQGNNNNNNHNKNRSRISPKTALKNTPYRGLNTAKKNKFDNLSESEISAQMEDCQRMLSNNELTNNLPDYGKKLKIKMQLLDEALIRVKARNIIHTKNNPIKKTLNFNFNFNRNDTQKRNIRADRNNFRNNKLAQNLNKNDLNEIINSIHTMSINPNDIDNSNNRQVIDENIKLSSDLKCTLYPHQTYGYQWMITRETHCCDGQPYGGIIADEMGLGKTMQMIALILSKHNIPVPHNNDFQACDSTLIICPVSVMNHWENEIRKHTKRGVLVIHRYHGNNRCKNIKKLIANYNVIITTYGSVQSEWNGWKKLDDDRGSKIKEIRKQIVMLQRPYMNRIHNEENVSKLKKLKIKLQMLLNKKYKKPILSEICFRRIVLDEAHQIKNYKSKTHKSICDLSAKCYWFMTATPIQNSLDDLYAAFHFLKYKYYSNYNNWKQAILTHSRGIQKIRTLLAIIMLRRMKKDYIKSDIESLDIDREDKKVIHLPPKKAVTHLIEFNEYERFIYKQLATNMTKIFAGYQENNSVGKNFSQCLKMLLQLRQACNHLILIKNSVYTIHSILKSGEDDNNNMDISQLLSVMNENDMNHSDEYLTEIKNALESGNDECPFCLDTIENVSITDCGHRFCTQCINQIIEDKERALQRKLKSIYSTNNLYIQCPVCRKKLKKSNITQIIDKNKQKNGTQFIENANEYLCKPSSKLQKLMEILEKIKEEETSSKCIIFSQWTSMLDIIEKELKYNNKYGEYCRLDGKMTANQRSKSINKLNTDRKCWIMLISLKAGGVGLNLVAANHVFLMDIWWNPAVEDQAMDRVHRIGQTKNVTMHRIVIDNSVEQKVLTLQDKKRKIAEEALNMNRNRNNKNKNKEKRSVNLNARDLVDLFRGDVMINNRNNYNRNRI